jgi:uncharacterized membrane protein YkoI
MITIAGAMLLAGCYKNNVEQASQEFNQLPVAVQQTTRTRMPNAEVAGVTKHNRNGVTVYEIKFRDDGRYPPLEVAEDGTVVKYEVGLARGGSMHTDRERPQRGGGVSDVTALPLPVQKAIRENTPPAEVSNIRRLEENNRVLYEVEFAGRGDNPRIRVSEDGTVLK